jgi:hypothetical protein
MRIATSRHCFFVAAAMKNNVNIVVRKGGLSPPHKQQRGTMWAGLNQVHCDASPMRTTQGQRYIFPRVEEGGNKTYFELILQQGGKNKSIFFV